MQYARRFTAGIRMLVLALAVLAFAAPRITLSHASSDGTTVRLEWAARGESLHARIQWVENGRPAEIQEVEGNGVKVTRSVPAGNTISAIVTFDGEIPIVTRTLCAGNWCAGAAGA